MNAVLAVSDLGKSYATYPSELYRFARWLGFSVKPVSEFWAVREVSFSLGAGEALALIGQNGAGKSSLLKLVTGVLRPTTGAVAVNGRVSAILELGLGFNPEFTGRENVRQSGGLLGYSSDEIEALMPAIEDFAELGEFFDKPLRLYSSGMQARLAFSLATASRPELLIVDEVLSVGDSYFQHKSFARIREYKEQGTAILFVTHSLSDVRALCDRAILLEGGRVKKDGHPDEVVDYYNALVAAKENEKLSVEQRRNSRGWLHTRSGTGEAVVTSAALRDAVSGHDVATATVGQELRFIVSAEIRQALPVLVCGVMIRDRLGHVVWGTNTWHTAQQMRDVPAGSTIEFAISFGCTLGPGSYSLSTALVSTDTHLEDNFDWQDNVLVFDVMNASHPFFIGSSFIPATFEVKAV